MATHIGIGFSQHPDPGLAAQEATQKAQIQLKHHSTDVVFVFSTVHYCSLEIVNRIRESLGSPFLIGCSSAGLILPEAIETKGVLVITMASDEFDFSFASVNEIEPSDTFVAGKRLAEEAASRLKDQKPKTMIMFADSLIENSYKILKGVQHTLGSPFPILGGGSIDNFQFRKSYQFFQNQLLTQSAVAILLGKHAQVSSANYHGWKPLGKPHIVDESSGGIIKKIDGAEAVTIYKKYFGEEALEIFKTPLPRMAILYPLGIYVEQENGYLIRNVIEIRDDGCIVCQGDIPKGAEIHLMIGNAEFGKEAALNAAKEIKEALPTDPKLILVFESLTRYKLFGKGNAINEILQIREILGPHIPFAGIYTYGEVSPFRCLKENRPSYWQNESITIITVS